jgi:hypothetical protein
MNSTGDPDRHRSSSGDESDAPTRDLDRRRRQVPRQSYRQGARLHDGGTMRDHHSRFKAAMGHGTLSVFGTKPASIHAPYVALVEELDAPGARPNTAGAPPPRAGGWACSEGCSTEGVL